MKNLKTFEGFNPYDDEPLTRSKKYLENKQD